MGNHVISIVLQVLSLFQNAGKTLHMTKCSVFIGETLYSGHDTPPRLVDITTRTTVANQ